MTGVCCLSSWVWHLGVLDRDEGTGSSSSVLLALSAPHRLGIHCTFQQTFWLLQSASDMSCTLRLLDCYTDH